MSKHDLTFCESRLVPLIRQIARRVKSIKYNYTLKENGSFVTDYDKVVEKALFEGLKKLVPNADFVSEETGLIRKKGSKYAWIIDPIDGTGNMLNGYPYTISVALLNLNTLNTMIGVVYDVQQNEVFYAVRNKGSYKKTYVVGDKHAQSKKRNKKTRLNIKNNSSTVGLIGMPYDKSKTDDIFKYARLLYKNDNLSDIKRVGPASLDICKVAEGKAKMYIEFDLELWDKAAGELILQEAGGKSFVNSKNLHMFASEVIIDKIENFNKNNL